MSKPYRGELGIMERLGQDGPLPSMTRIAQDRRDAMAEIERLRGEKSYLEDAVIPALKQDAERLEAALIEYGRHVPTCPRLGPNREACNCGLFDAIGGHQQSAIQEK